MGIRRNEAVVSLVLRLEKSCVKLCVFGEELLKLVAVDAVELL